MVLNLDKLLTLDSPEVVTDHARFYCHVPKVAPYAYLHTIFNPASPDTLRSVADELEIPRPWVSFLEIQNGAWLFSGALRLNGVIDPNRLHSRQSNYAEIPYSPTETSWDHVINLLPEWLGIGDYGFDGSRILMNRQNAQIQVLDRTGTNALAIWNSVEAFLIAELKRIGALFSPLGECQVDHKFTVPHQEMIF